MEMQRELNTQPGLGILKWGLMRISLSGSSFQFFILSVCLAGLGACASTSSTRSPSSLGRVQIDADRWQYSPLGGLRLPEAMDPKNESLVAKLSYQLSCGEKAYLTPGYIQLSDRNVHFQLIPEKNEIEVLLGPTPAFDEVEFFKLFTDKASDERSCEVNSLDLRFESIRHVSESPTNAFDRCADRRVVS